MFTTLLLLGMFGGVDTEVEAARGPIIAIPERIVVLEKVPATSSVRAPLPVNSYQWKAPFDPADREPFAFDWRKLLVDETIDEIVRITMSAAGASVGIRVDQGAGRLPRIDEAGQFTQVWFYCEEAFQQNAAFAGAGVQVGVAIMIRTDADPFAQLERTAVLTVKHL